MMKVSLDTNILIDVLEQRVPYFKAAANILDLGVNGRMKLYASALTFVNCIYIVRKKAGYSKVIESVRLLRDIISVSPMTRRSLIWLWQEWLRMWKMPCNISLHCLPDVNL